MEELRQQTISTVDDLRTDGLADYIECADERDGSTFRVLASPEAINKKQCAIVVSGIPEEAGVWSYTLISKGMQAETSMRPYFEMARDLNWGMLALNPHGRGRIGEKEEYFFQLRTVLSLLDRKNTTADLVFLCFSAGGSIVFEYLNDHTRLVDRIRGIFLIDTTPPPLAAGSIKTEVKNLLPKTKLYGLIDKQNSMSPYASATSAILGIKPIPISAVYHGELPTLVLPDVKKYLEMVGS